MAANSTAAMRKNTAHEKEWCKILIGVGGKSRYSDRLCPQKRAPAVGRTIKLTKTAVKAMK